MLPDGSRLFFSSVRPVNPAGGTPRPDFDLWVTDRTAQGGWGPPRHPAEVNTAARELNPWVAPDGSFLLFTSAGQPDSLGSSDLAPTRTRHRSPRTAGPCSTAATSGSATYRRRGRSTCRELIASLESVRNGLENIYTTDLPIIQP